MYKVKTKVQLDLNTTIEYKIPEEFQEALKLSGLELELKDLKDPNAFTKETIKEFIKKDFEKTKGTKVNFISVNIEKDEQ